MWCTWGLIIFVLISSNRVPGCKTRAWKRRPLSQGISCCYTWQSWHKNRDLGIGTNQRSLGVDICGVDFEPEYAGTKVVSICLFQNINSVHNREVCCFSVSETAWKMSRGSLGELRIKAPNARQSSEEISWYEKNHDKWVLFRSIPCTLLGSVEITCFISAGAGHNLMGEGGLSIPRLFNIFLVHVYL